MPIPAMPPTDADPLIQVEGQTGSPAHEYSLTSSTTTLVVPSPRSLSQGLNKFNWMVMTIPFKVETPTSVAEMNSYPTE
jgi:hypothetical protein